MRVCFKILVLRGVGWLHVRHLHGRIYARREFGCRLRAAHADSVRMYLPGAAIEILKFEACSTLNLIGSQAAQASEICVNFV